ncbi:casein kinase ii subunit beta [Anaeramoeba flamelloides]|uniref:Casein kinase II subunit beta n=1 Tax=Anaeramoeba flamelloides TaxID=1746091 RepID=A0AAV7YTS2_9EUKA|nr:casein kinase ii subunit beta [Anaeramoeba flamelloides]
MGSSEKEEKTWVRWFLSLERNDILTEVRPYFLEDNFNYTGLSNYVPSYSLALRTIRTLEISDKEILTQEQEELIQGAAKLLYGLIHARWIVTPHGAKNMIKKFQEVKFGTCPRVYCENQPCLPIGLSDIIGEAKLKIFCPKCQQIFKPRIKRHAIMDGAFFGTTFAHFLMNSAPELRPRRPTHKHVPKIMGFTISDKVSPYQNKKKPEKAKKNEKNEIKK